MVAPSQLFRIIRSAREEARIITVKLARVYKRALRFGETNLRKKLEIFGVEKNRMNMGWEGIVRQSVWRIPARTSATSFTCLSRLDAQGYNHRAGI
jgi:hypothetical protein